MSKDLLYSCFQLDSRHIVGLQRFEVCIKVGTREIYVN